METNDILGNALNTEKAFENEGIIKTLNTNLEVLSYAYKHLGKINNNLKSKIIYSYGNNNILIVEKQLNSLIASKYILSFTKVNYNIKKEYIINEETDEQYPGENILLKGMLGEPLYIIFFNPKSSKIKYLQNIDKLLYRKTREERKDILDTKDIKHCIEQYKMNPNLMEHFLRRHEKIFPTSTVEEYMYDLLFYIKIQFREDYNYFVEGIDDYKEKEERIINIKLGRIKIEANKKTNTIIFWKELIQLGYLDVNKTTLGKILMYCFKNNEHGPISLEDLFLSIGPAKNYIDADKSYRDAKYQFLKNSATKISKLELDELIYKGKDKHIYINYTII